MRERYSRRDKFLIIGYSGCLSWTLIALAVCIAIELLG